MQAQCSIEYLKVLLMITRTREVVVWNEKQSSNMKYLIMKYLTVLAISGLQYKTNIYRIDLFCVGMAGVQCDRSKLSIKSHRNSLNLAILTFLICCEGEHDSRHETRNLKLSTENDFMHASEDNP